MTKSELLTTVKQNKELYEIASRLKKVSTPQNIQSILAQMNLPFGKHMFIVTNYHDLMSLDYKELK